MHVPLIERNRAIAAVRRLVSNPATRERLVTELARALGQQPDGWRAELREPTPEARRLATTQVAAAPGAD